MDRQGKRKEPATKAVSGEACHSMEDPMGVRNFSCRDEACQDAGFPVFAPGLVPEVSKPDDPYGGVVGTSLAIRYVRRLVETVAGGGATARWLGEAGTGKELTARAVDNRR